jgi:hypothetical protein
MKTFSKYDVISFEYLGGGEYGATRRAIVLEDRQFINSSGLPMFDLDKCEPRQFIPTKMKGMAFTLIDSKKFVKKDFPTHFNFPYFISQLQEDGYQTYTDNDVIIAYKLPKPVKKNLLTVDTNCYKHLARIGIPLKDGTVQSLDINKNGTLTLLHRSIYYDDPTSEQLENIFRI